MAAAWRRSLSGIMSEYVFMPTGTIKRHNDPVIRVLEHLVKKYLHAISVDMRQYQ